MCSQARYSEPRITPEMTKIVLQGSSVTMEEEVLLHRLVNLLDINGREITITDLLKEAMAYIRDLQQALS